MVSGSVSLEMLARRTPFVALYRSSWLTYIIGSIVIVCKYWSLPNLIAGRKVMPECFSVGNPNPVIDEVVAEISKWLQDPAALATVSTPPGQLAVPPMSSWAGWKSRRNPNRHGLRRRQATPLGRIELCHNNG